ncbi:F0F1 ATP synthase subunit gamma [Caulobacter flavus]|jgi:F-type H+-transporting ATPase subunit gamma|uniref:ATP synthase gamma chain n=3 Tax=Caulobacter TaxID=75 RepID=A0A2T9K7A6_9CAUL|nr:MULTISPECIES: F0F1 ATP synthase subunit gamma [Caulobacter]AYV45447.1 F0F1 ATP synthase subunit gamma [Caulobacter flavus]PLR17679.1 F0F1 ATP synthase subunit gamma [Caulobacter flavus]PLR27814.1 F0F1 ATP synthase subunit gamma [Caulobacter zeae]PVM82755.1 F0F1 ATP synthase subunit gamma [Caulobacter radicis]PVM91671.1 F0F1 ATP synthase subunit gamma [Caulobacter radicis]
MASLKEMRNRISSVKATQKITKAMQMVAAAKLRRSQDAAEAARPYARRLASVIANLATGVSGDGAPALLAGTGRDDRHLVVVAAADRGLAGGFTSSIVRAARAHIDGLIAQGKDVKIVCVGKKVTAQLKRPYGDKVVDNFDLSAYRQITLSVAQPIADVVTKLYEAGDIDVVTLFYSRFRSVVQQVPTALQLIPAVVEGGAEVASGPAAVYEYEPSEEAILETLLPRNLTVQILSALLDNMAGFYASQMTAMDNATRNAGDMIKRYTLEYNRSRQAQITKELIEIISGAEAV